MAQTGDYMRECKKVGEIAVVQVGRGRVSTTRAMEFTSSTGSFKRRKLVSNADDQLVSSRFDVNLPATSEASGGVPVSRCSSTESSEFVRHELRSVELKAESPTDGFETEISTLLRCRFSREKTPSSELCAEIDEMESSTATKPSAASLRRKHPVVKMPPPTEIEEFFSAAEKYERKRFVDKYNYDVVKDVPLEGRYQWVRLKP